MKPISLTIAGLHSFREKQEIDFAALCEGGVFGIFGPTGSGKSSILDAMTLSLYGKVERAANNTQGIMNHAENVVEVCYIFDLENAKGKQRFKVERTFKRTDEIRVKSGICRLSEIKDSEHIVLADKAADVNKAIQEIVGLTIDDFTRAVVLPQGKFAEFLALKGAERRQMLQRLFQLEKYGDELSRKIKESLQQKSRMLGEMEAEQLGLGDASDKAVEEAAKAHQEIAASAEKSEHALQQLEGVFDEQKKKWEWQIEKERVEQSLGRLKQSEQEINELEAKISKAEQAGVLKPLLDEMTNLETIVQQWQNTFVNDKVAYQTAQKVLEKTVKAYEAAREKKERQHPLLLAKKEQGERALKLEEVIHRLEKEREVLDQRLQKRKEYLVELGAKEIRTREIYLKAAAKQKSLKEELASITLPAERLEALQQAFDKKQEIVQLEKRWEEASAEDHNLSRKLEVFKNEKLTAETELKKAEAKLQAFFQQTETYYAKAAELTFQLDWLLHQAEHFLLEEKKKLESKKLQELAIELRGKLMDGEACPVCGSTNHPFHEIKHENRNNEMVGTTAVEKLLKTIHQEKQHNVTMKLTLEQLASELFQEVNGLRELPKPDHFSKKMEEWEKSYHASEKYKHLLLEHFHSIETEQKALRQDILLIQERKGELYQASRKWNSAKNEAVKLMQSYEEQWTVWNNRQLALRKEADDKVAAWNETFPKESYEKLEQHFHQAKDIEKQMRELQARINKSVAFIEEKETELKKVQNVKTEEDKAFFQENLEREQLHKRAIDAKAELTGIVEDKTAQEFLQKIHQELNDINQYEQSAYQEWMEAQASYHELDKKVKHSEQMAADTMLRLQQLKNNWEIAIGNASFDSKEEVITAIGYMKEKEGWKKRVQHYWEECKSLEKERDKLQSLVGELRIREEEWRQLQEELLLLKQKLREEIEEKSAAYHHLSSIRERNKRYAALEELKERLSKETERYQKLQAVFKGNGFVEYLAEEQLLQISRDASERLGQLTRQRYALEIDSQGGFIIRDDANGGVRRPVSTLSGGETFLTSLALALSLSTQIQLRGEYPLQFFFLDEGFGTLDQELLDGVVSALEKLQSNHLAVGVISHVQELRARLPRRLVVTPSDATGKGSLVRLENL